MHDVTVTRHSFFQRYGERSISFVEKHPPGDELAHGHGCGCTRRVCDVSQRPEGVPDQVNERLEVHLASSTSTRAGEEFLVRFDAYETSIHVRWGHKPIDRPGRLHPALEPDATRGDFEEATFRFSGNELTVDVGVWTSSVDRTLPDDVAPMSDGARYFHAKLFQGRAIDVRRFMNGHTPSRVVRFGLPGEDVGSLGDVCPATPEALANGALIADDTLWVHHCGHYGGEALRIFGPESMEEVAFWRNMIGWVQDARRVWTAASDASVSVAEVAQRVRESSLRETVVGASRLLSGLLDRIGSTDLFSIAQAVRAEADRRGAAALEADEREREAFWAAHPELRAEIDESVRKQAERGEDPILGPLQSFFASQGKILVDVTPPNGNEDQSS